MEFTRAIPDRTAAAVFAATFPQEETAGVEQWNANGGAFSGRGLSTNWLRDVAKADRPSRPEAITLPRRRFWH